MVSTGGQGTYEGSVLAAQGHVQDAHVRTSTMSWQQLLPFNYITAHEIGQVTADSNNSSISKSRLQGNSSSYSSRQEWSDDDA